MSNVLGNYIYDITNNIATATVKGGQVDSLSSLPLGVTGGGEVFLKTGPVGGGGDAVTVADGADVAEGTTTDAPVANNTTVASATAATGIGLWKRLVNLGIAILAKQPSLGTAGTASTNVLSVQGIASGTALSVSDLRTVTPHFKTLGASGSQIIPIGTRGYLATFLTGTGTIGGEVATAGLSVSSSNILAATVTVATDAASSAFVSWET